MAYGPRAQLSFGADPELLRWGSSGRPFRLDTRVALATENATSRRPLLATEAGRLWLDLGLEKVLSGSVVARAGDLLLLRASLGVERTWRDTEAAFEAPRPWDLPFGAGGVFTSFSVTWALRRRSFWLRGHWAERVYLPGWLSTFGARSEADLVGSALATGIAHAPSVELTLLLPTVPLTPAVAFLVEHQIPLDDAARPTFFGRLLAGPTVGRGWWFVSADAGNGKGHLSVRREARLSLGVRLALP
jgi:hypothetical protein